MKVSANLGFLWTDRPLPDAVRAAARAGFDAVECHGPYDTPPADLRAALEETGLPLLGLNTTRGDRAAGQIGRAALPGFGAEARADIDGAIAYAHAVGAGSIHVLAGRTSGGAARKTFAEALTYAAEAAPDLTILTEPLSPASAEGYLVTTVAEAAGIIADIGAPNVKILFDCYHVGMTEGDILSTLDAYWPLIGHIQIASIPDRQRPDLGTFDYRALWHWLATRGWTRPFGAEYHPRPGTGADTGWIATFKEAVTDG